MGVGVGVGVGVALMDPIGGGTGAATTRAVMLPTHSKTVSMFVSGNAPADAPAVVHPLLTLPAQNSPTTFFAPVVAAAATPAAAVTAAAFAAAVTAAAFAAAAVPTRSLFLRSSMQSSRLTLIPTHVPTPRLSHPNFRRSLPCHVSKSGLTFPELSSLFELSSLNEWLISCDSVGPIAMTVREPWFFKPSSS